MFGAHIYPTDVNRKPRPTFEAAARVPPDVRKGKGGIGSGEGGDYGRRDSGQGDCELKDWG